MKKIFVTLFALGLFLGVNNASKAAVLTFDDITDNGGGTQIFNGYGGLNWDNMYVLNAADFSTDYGQTGFSNGTVSSPNVAFNGGGAPATMNTANSSNFTFNSAYFTGAWNNGLNILVQGFENGALVPGDDTTITVDSKNPTLETFNFQGINSLKFTSSGGTNAGYDGAGDHFAMDNISYNDAILNQTQTPTPEPTSILLGFLGIGGLLGFKRRK